MAKLPVVLHVPELQQETISPRHSVKKTRWDNIQLISRQCHMVLCNQMVRVLIAPARSGYTT